MMENPSLGSNERVTLEGLECQKIAGVQIASLWTHCLLLPSLHISFVGMILFSALLIHFHWLLFSYVKQDYIYSFQFICFPIKAKPITEKRSKSVKYFFIIIKCVLRKKNLSSLHFLLQIIIFLCF